ncbi:MAG: NAD-dependent epimerase/dehydratase family protein, partial [Halobacteria archaeon]|nr:NAD-dependent epimerase/dehydratase family protein [Halobacteria archaeon]
MTSSTVVGCGYVGTVLAQNLVQRGHDVYAVSRSGVDIEGVESLEIDVTDSDGFDLPETDYVYYLVSAGSRDVDRYREAYIDGMKNTFDALDGSYEFVYSSSTGVYETDDGSWVDESTEIEPESRRSEVMLEA